MLAAPGPIAYLDASVIVRLIFREPGSQDARQLLAVSSGTITSAVAYVEVLSALARKAREGALSAEGHRRAVQQFTAAWRSHVTVDPGPVILRVAGELTFRRGLRALDAIHLASALEGRPRGPLAYVFVTADRRLQAAADEEGLVTMQL